MTVHRSRLKSTLPDKVAWHSLTDGPDGGKQPPDRAAAPPAKPLNVDGRHSTARTTTSKRRIQRRLTPLEMIQYPLQVTRQTVFDLRRFFIVLGLTGLVLLLPFPPSLSQEGQRAFALFVFTGSILALEPAPLPISALLVPVAQVALGIDDVSGAFSAFAQPSLFLVLSSLFLAEALRKHGLTRRLAIYAIIASGGYLPRLLFNLMLMTSLLSMWVLNTATTAILIPVALTIAQHIPQPDQARRTVATLVIGIAYAASLGGMATVVGSGENAIAAGYLNVLSPFTFMDWSLYAVPLIMLLMPLTWWLLIKVMKMPTLKIDIMPVLREFVRLGPLSETQVRILLVLGLCVILWVFGGYMEGVLNLPQTLLSSAIVSIVAVAFLSISEVVDWNDLKGVNWGVFLVIGAGFTLGDALQKTGASAWFADMLAPVLTGLPLAVVLLSVILMGFTLTQFMNNVALGAILSPLLISVAAASGIEPVQLVMPAMLSLGVAYMLPSASARMTLVSVSGAVQRKEMLMTGLVIGLPSVLLIAGMFILLSRMGLI
ncbi:MAG: DASS family sodium-coupled anion symporter [Caldilineaceae bacterium]|jgi:sodium-dependent dicarboxylate transporter 2/3/5|nr:DASS family sodium-coupled anion symporter [Caldilineaceae bacterium]